MCIIVHVDVYRRSLLGFSPWVSPEIHIPYLLHNPEKQTVFAFMVAEGDVDIKREHNTNWKLKGKNYITMIAVEESFLAIFIRNIHIHIAFTPWIVLIEEYLSLPTSTLHPKTQPPHSIKSFHLNQNSWSSPSKVIRSIALFVIESFSTASTDRS